MIADFTEWKIRKLIADAKSQVEAEVTTALLTLYLSREIEVDIVGGELVFHMSSQLELPLEHLA